VHLPRKLGREQRQKVAKRGRAARSGSKRRGVPSLGAPDREAGCALVVGLGNPGRKYRSTRHNLGRMAAELLLQRSDILGQGKWPEGKLALASDGGRRFLILVPETFMNLSGRAVAPVLQRYGLSPSEMIVIHDDIDLPLGDVRLKEGGGTGGHQGLNSLVDAIGDKSFSRIRIGVGRPPAPDAAADYVLSPPAEEEAEQARRAVDLAADYAAGAVKGTDSGA